MISANHNKFKQHNEPLNTRRNTRKGRQAWENARDQTVIAFGLASAGLVELVMDAYSNQSRKPTSYYFLHSIESTSGFFVTTHLLVSTLVLLHR